MLGVALAVSGCRGDSIGLFVPAAADGFAQHFIEVLRTQPVANIGAYVAPATVNDPQFGPLVTEMRRVLPAAPSDSIRLTGLEIICETSRPMVRRMVYEVFARGRSARVELWIEEAEPGRYHIESFRVRARLPSDQALGQMSPV